MSQHTKERTEELGGFAEHEVRNAYPCGCVAVVCQCGCGNPPEIIECSLHAHAQAMREVLGRVARLCCVTEFDDTLDCDDTDPCINCELNAEARAILRAIEGA